MNGIKVAKFGGTSLADASQIAKVLEIVRSDPLRQYVVVSAPGKRNAGDQKITDLLFGLHQGGLGNLSPEEIFRIICERFQGIVNELGLQLDLDRHLDTIRDIAKHPQDLDFLVSRGEWLMARILAEALDYEFVDAAKVIWFNLLGQFDMAETMRNRPRLMKGKRGYVIPGFYGSLTGGRVKTFTRGGSDLTGAIIAALVGADVYENWTDVSGICMADPEVVRDVQKVDVVTYRELRELTYMGARVLHDEVIFPIKEAGIPIRVLNTNSPKDEGTLIVPDSQAPERRAGSIVGIAGRKNFTVITVEKMLMNQEVGFVRKICAALENNGISIEHIPGGIDTLSIIAESEPLGSKLDLVRADIERECEPNNITVSPNMALVCIVGHAMVHTPGVAARAFQAVANAGISIRMIDQGSSELSIIIGVENDDYENTVRAIYGAFIK